MTKQIMKVLSLFDYQGIQIDLLRSLLNSPDLAVISELESCGWLTVNRKQVMLHPLMLEYIRTWSWDDNGIRGADTAMKNLYQLIKPESGQTDADKQYVRNYSELAKFLFVAEQLIANTDYVSAPKQKLKYRVLMDAPVDQDESALDRMLELLDNPVFLDNGRILRMYEWTAFLLNRLGRFPEAFVQLEKMKTYLSSHQSTFYLSLYHRAMATVLHDSDMYGNQAECQRHEDSAIFTARVSKHQEAKVHLAACLMDKAQNLISVDMDDEQAWNLLQEAKQIVIHDDNCYCKYYDVVYILFHTGIWISEFCGLTIRDVDLKNRILNIDHQLQRTSDMKYVIEKTKTNAGTRKLPMNDDVTECFRRILKAREAPEVEKIIDGHSGFLFLDDNGMPEVAMHWEHRFNHMVHRYNEIFREQMPNITPHVCRHTYCSLQAKAGMYPKTLQYLMGHSDISVTMNTYTHLGLEDAVEEMSRMQDVENARKEQEKLKGKTDEVKISKNQFRAG